MLDSLSWFDRDKATGVLYAVTEGRDKRTLTRLRMGGLPALAEMARWKASYGHDAFKLISRVAGLSDVEGEKAWDQGSAECERVVQLAARADTLN